MELTKIVSYGVFFTMGLYLALALEVDPYYILVVIVMVVMAIITEFIARRTSISIGGEK